MEYLIFDIILVCFCLIALFGMGLVIGYYFGRFTNTYNRKKSKTKANFINVKDLD